MFTIVGLHSHRIDFFNLQRRSIEKFVKCRFNYIPIINSANPAVSKELIKESLKWGYTPYVTDQKLSPKYFTQNQMVGEGMNRFWADYLPNLSGILGVLDSDVFFTRDFDPELELVDTSILASLVRREGRAGAYNHLHPFPSFYNLRMLPKLNEINWHMTQVGEGVLTDNFGDSYNYLSDNPGVVRSIKPLPWSGEVCSENGNLNCIHPELRPYYNEKYGIEYFGDFMLHFARGAGWDSNDLEIYEAKLDFIKVYMEALLNEKIPYHDTSFFYRSSTHGWD